MSRCTATLFHLGVKWSQGTSMANSCSMVPSEATHPSLCPGYWLHVHKIHSCCFAAAMSHMGYATDHHDSAITCAACFPGFCVCIVWFHCRKTEPSNPRLTSCNDTGRHVNIPKLQSTPNYMSSSLQVRNMNPPRGLTYGLLAHEPFSSTVVFAASDNARKSCSSRVAVSKNLASSFETRQACL